MSPTHQDLSNDTTFSQIKSRVPVPLRSKTTFFLIIGKQISSKKDFEITCSAAKMFDTDNDSYQL